MRILILNWRDTHNPASGGAEILTHEMAKLWVTWGHSVTQISANFNRSPKTENIDGVGIIRVGSWWSVHVLAFFNYCLNSWGRFDVIIDEVHGLPFFSKLYAPSKTILFACEVADELFFEVFPLPVAIVGRILEKIYFKIYKNVPALAISPSTKNDLIRQGFKKAKITVLPMGLTIPKNLKKATKEKRPTLIYLSRLNKRKGVEDVIEIFYKVQQEIPESHLWIVGGGSPEYVRKIKDRIRRYRLTSHVKFFGYVSDKEKFSLLSQAHILAFPSVHEGWGLVIVEAAIVGTPSAVYDVPGTRDVIDHGKSGIMAPFGRPDLLAQAIIRVLKNDKLYKEQVKKIKSFEKYIGWQKTAKVAMSVIKKYEKIK